MKNIIDIFIVFKFSGVLSFGKLVNVLPPTLNSHSYLLFFFSNLSGVVFVFNFFFFSLTLRQIRD